MCTTLREIKTCVFKSRHSKKIFDFTPHGGPPQHFRMCYYYPTWNKKVRIQVASLLQENFRLITDHPAEILDGSPQHSCSLTSVALAITTGAICQIDQPTRWEPRLHQWQHCCAQNGEPLQDTFLSDVLDNPVLRDTTYPWTLSTRPMPCAFWNLVPCNWKTNWDGNIGHLKWSNFHGALSKHVPVHAAIHRQGSSWTKCCGRKSNGLRNGDPNKFARDPIRRILLGHTCAH